MSKPTNDLYANSFQVHNNYVDEFLHLLTGEETKVLLYAIRTIKGFWKSQDRISISQFERGKRSKKTGEFLDHGTGLNRETVIRALSELKSYGLLVEIAPNDKKSNEGACYSLQFEYDKINILGLEARLKAKQLGNKHRTISARSKSIASLSDRLGVVCATDQLSQSVRQTKGWSVPQTEGGLSDRPEVVCATDQGWSVRQTHILTEENQKEENQKETQEQPSCLAFARRQKWLFSLCFF